MKIDGPFTKQWANGNWRIYYPNGDTFAACGSDKAARLIAAIPEMVEALKKYCEAELTVVQRYHDVETPATNALRKAGVIA